MYQKLCNWATDWKSWAFKSDIFSKLHETHAAFRIETLNCFKGTFIPECVHICCHREIKGVLYKKNRIIFHCKWNIYPFCIGFRRRTPFSYAWYQTGLKVNPTDKKESSKEKGDRKVCYNHLTRNTKASAPRHLVEEAREDPFLGFCWNQTFSKHVYYSLKWCTMLRVKGHFWVNWQNIANFTLWNPDELWLGAVEPQLWCVEGLWEGLETGLGPFLPPFSRLSAPSSLFISLAASDSPLFALPQLWMSLKPKLDNVSCMWCTGWNDNFDGVCCCSILTI